MHRMAPKIETRRTILAAFSLPRMQYLLVTTLREIFDIKFEVHRTETVDPSLLDCAVEHTKPKIRMGWFWQAREDFLLLLLGIYCDAHSRNVGNEYEGYTSITGILLG